MADNKHVFQLRRGTRYVDANGTTLLNPDGTPVRDDWATYTAQAVHINPLEGELVLEYEEVYGTGKKTPRLKIGDGTSTFAELEYMSVDSFILPKPLTIILYGGDAWKLVSEGKYEQEITNQLIGKVTPNSKVDLQPTPSQLAIFHEKDVAFTTVNEDGRIYVYAIGTMPQNTYTNLQITITEVVVNE